MNKEELKSRTKALALRVMAMIDHLPNTTKGRVIADQIMRSATSVASNYRAACRGRSRAKFISKLGVALEEVDESMLVAGTHWRRSASSCAESERSN
jgi:four helix bundle protein